MIGKLSIIVSRNPAYSASGRPLPERMLHLLLAASCLAVAGAAPANAADIFKGGELYRSHCQNCHGADGRGVVPGIPDFRRGDALMRADPDLFQSIRQGKGAMPAYRGILTEEETLDVVAYLRTLRR